MNRGLAAGEAVAGGFFEAADAIGKGGGRAIDCGRGMIVGGGGFDFGDESRADNRGVGESAEHGDVAWERNAEANGERQLRDAASAAQECRKIVGEHVFGAGNAGARDEIEKARSAGGDFFETLVGGRGGAKKNGVEIFGGNDAAILFGLFWREIGNEDAVGSEIGGGGSKFFEAHLEDGVVVAEEDERDFAGFADFADEIENFGESCAGFESAF